MWSTFAIVAAGGAFGAVARHGLAIGLGRTVFPWSTLIVNASGSLLFGFLAVCLSERLPLAADLRAFLLIGVLGGFTTFSTFSWETMALLENGDIGKAGASIVLNVLLSLFAVAGGIWLARQIA